MNNNLALFGGTPVRKTLLQYGRQHVDDRDIQLVIECLKGDYLTTGPYVEKFEQLLAETVNAKYAVAVSSGTAALHIACQAAGIGFGDEVITTPLSFAATANCIRYCGATPVFTDINPETCQIDPYKIKENITSKTKAIIPVHYAGETCDMDAIEQLANEYNLIVIEDAAHAIGSIYKDKTIGSISSMTEFSFHPVKTITTGEGGAITTNDKALYEKLRQYRTHGITRDTSLMSNQQEGDWYYEQLALGNNYRITDMQCALGIGQLEKLSSFQKRRAILVDKYDNILSKWDTIRVLQRTEGSVATRHLYPIMLQLEVLNGSRKAIYEALKAEGIGVNVHYIPIYLFPDYQQMGYRRGLCPNAEQVYKTLITLPLFSDMTDYDFNDVIDALDKVLSYYKR